MKGPVLSVVMSTALAALAIAGCGRNAAPAGPTAQAPLATPGALTETGSMTPASQAASASAETSGGATVVVGYTVSRTGALEVESSQQANGVQLWADTVNAAGGLTLSDGTMRRIEVRTYDDESSAQRVAELYGRLAADEGVDFLIGPYSSGLTDVAAPIAAERELLMISAGAASDGPYEKGYEKLYQVYTPISRYMTGAIDWLVADAPSVRHVAFLHEEDDVSTRFALAARDAFERKALQTVLFEGYPSGTTDFGPFIDEVTASNAEALIGGGHYQDGQALALQLYERSVPLQLLALLVAPAESAFAELGDAAVGVVGTSQWEPNACYTPDHAREAQREWYGPTCDEFVSGYESAFGATPSYHAAGGFAAGLLLERAIESAGSLDSAAVAAALDSLHFTTFFGHLGFDTSATSHGLQFDHQMVYIQWQRDESGAIGKEVVYPEEVRTAPLVVPLR